MADINIIHVTGNTYCVAAPLIYIPFYQLNEQDIVLMDSGLYREGDEIEAALLRNGLKVKYILTSHTHYDHIGNHLRFQKKYGAAVYESLYDAAYSGLPASIQARLACYTRRDYNKYYFTDGKLRADTYIRPWEQSVEIEGRTFGVVHTPGHGPDHLCFITPDRAAYLGDLMVSADKLDTLSLLYVYDYRMELESLRLFEKNDCDVYILAHKGLTDDIASLNEKNREKLLRDLALAESYLEDWTDMSELTARVGAEKTNASDYDRMSTVDEILTSAVSFLVAEHKVRCEIINGKMSFRKEA